MNRDGLAAFAFTALVIFAFSAAPKFLSAADKPAEKPAGKQGGKKDAGKEGDKAGARKEKAPAVATPLLDESGSFGATGAGEKYLGFETRGEDKIRITWAASDVPDKNEHVASFLRLTLMHEVELDNAYKQKVWKLYGDGVITKQAAAGDSDQGTLNLPPNKYAVVASGSNIGYRVKVEQIGGTQIGGTPQK